MAVNDLEKGRLSGGFHILLSVLAVVLLGTLSWGLMAGNIVSTVIAGVGLATVITTASFSLLASDDRRSQTTESILRMASATQFHMRGGLTAEGCQAVCRLLLPETAATAIAMTDNHTTLAYAGETTFGIEEGDPNSVETTEVLENGRLRTVSSLHEQTPRYNAAVGGLTGAVRSYPVGVIVPLTVSERTVGTL